MMSQISPILTPRIVGLTIIAMLAFAANSLFCRLALAPDLIDAASFTTVRTIAGAATLALIVFVRQGSMSGLTANWRTILALFIYLVFFSFAYVSLGAGTGALILFGAVQLTMLITALRQGEAFPALSWAGLALALAGLVYLVSPGLSAPDPAGAIMMAVAGVAWGFYSLLGREAVNPLLATASNFIFSMPLALVVSLALISDMAATPVGLALAIASGAIASGCGYVIWYAALPGLTGTRAATVQLSVPVIAAIGGVILLSEDVTGRLVLASSATIGGVALVLSQKAKTD